jgi:5,5'-dehydrodivanillate O-demethylase oxygenase subunit
MLTKEQNERLTQVGPGTPGGELLRRYWQVLCPAGEITEDRPKKRVRLLGEDLLVYRGDDGAMYCIEEHCLHRRASLFYGFIEPGGIRCCYHGWKFDCAGKCTERPFEKQTPDNLGLKAYPVQELGGLLFAYMGPDPAPPPLLPHWDVLARNDRRRTVIVLPVHTCNWLQIQENTVDSVHTYYLHGHMSVVKNLPTLGQGAYFYRPITGYDWGVCEWGIEKTLEYGGDKPEMEIRPPLIFPNILRIPEGPVEALHFRVPIDDMHTHIFWVGLMPHRGDGPDPAAGKTTFEYAPDKPLTESDEELMTFYGQDRVVWETQGAVFDRSTETLGASDRGIVMFRRMLEEQIERVERGGEPNVAVVRDPARNTIIAFESATKPRAGSDEEHVFAAN